MAYEVFKMLLALLSHLGLEIIANGRGIRDEKVTDEFFDRSKAADYRYTIQRAQ